jgi:hypothetical protein
MNNRWLLAQWLPLKIMNIYYKLNPPHVAAFFTLVNDTLVISLGRTSSLENICFAGIFQGDYVHMETLLEGYDTHLQCNF